MRSQFLPPLVQLQQLRKEVLDIGTMRG
jgi:hypothetical protein